MAERGLITAVEPIVLRVPFADGGEGLGMTPGRWNAFDIVLVRAETDDGAIGWGEAFGYFCAPAVASVVRELVAPLVVGRPLDDVAALNKELQRRLTLFGRYGITIFALSGVDTALWDLKAKREGLSLAALLGGRTRETVPAYASLVRYADPALVERFAAQARADGYADVKLHEIARDTIAAGRRGTGPAARMTVDVNCAWSVAETEAILPFLRDQDVYWLEEPIFPPEDYDALAALGRFGVPIAAGENACTAMEFRRLAPAVTYPQPSVTKVGGISEFLEVTEVAAAAERTLMPHSPYFGPGYFATLQLAAALPAFGMFEYLYVEPEAWLGLDTPQPSGGEVAIPDALGLGFAPDPTVIERFRVA